MTFNAGVVFPGQALNLFCSSSHDREEQGCFLTFSMTFVGARPIKMRSLVMNRPAFQVIPCFLRIHSTSDVDYTCVLRVEKNCETLVMQYW